MYLLEAGLLLIVAPWSRFWDRNYFTALLPVAAEWLTHPYLRGAVTGVGIVSVVAAVLELAAMLWRRTPRAAGSEREA